MLDLMPRPIGRPRSCHCGSCHRCKKAAYMHDWWHRRTLRQRRDLIARRDSERVRVAELARGKTRLKQEAIERSRRRHPERTAARRAVQAAVARGDITKSACHCGETKVEGHHPDYTKPLEVEWLCRRHHADRHLQAA